MSRRLLGHLAVAVIGLAVALWAIANLLNPSITCRGVPMAPGDTCSNAAGTKMQTYEDRLEALEFSTPVMVGAGVLVAAFGVGLGVAEVRRTGSSGRTRPDLPPTA